MNTNNCTNNCTCGSLQSLVCIEQIHISLNKTLFLHLTQKWMWKHSLENCLNSEEACWMLRESKELSSVCLSPFFFSKLSVHDRQTHQLFQRQKTHLQPQKKRNQWARLCNPRLRSLRAEECSALNPDCKKRTCKAELEHCIHSQSTALTTCPS